MKCLEGEVSFREALPVGTLWFYADRPSSEYPAGAMGYRTNGAKLTPAQMRRLAAKLINAADTMEKGVQR